MKTKKENRIEINLLLKEIEYLDKLLLHGEVGKDFIETVLKVKAEVEAKIKDLQDLHYRLK